MYRYKQLIIIVSIVIIIIILDIILGKVSINKFNSINDKLNIIDSNIFGMEDENVTELEGVKKITEEMQKEWKDSQRVLSCFMEHDELEKIGNRVAILNTQINSNNFADAKQGIEEIRFLIEHLEDKQKVSLSNIF